ncbi:site-specific integrase [Nocardia arthritidis]|uniref:Site-specific integrase n=1 Tax=Nocardia arthritidis TaxID=228602 RepID=A0A6G9Y9R6_9NOCA|nr:site-specific integrase [Nocardia arthritidis]QIS09796.1 site-specific integrase [Nocardia arthritidis]
MTMTAPRPRDDSGRSPFALTDVCDQAGLALPAGAHRPVFEDDLWDFTDVVGLPVDMTLVSRRFTFVGIIDLRWRLVAKELIMALLAPRHPAVVRLPRAYRTPLHLRSCRLRLSEISRFFDWLASRGITMLSTVDTSTCEAYLAFRRYLTVADGTVVGEQSPAIRRSAAQIILDLIDYRDLFTADRVSESLRPWGGATASAVAEMPSGRMGNKTPPIAGEMLQPMLAAALHLVEVLGPHAIELNEQIRETDRLSSLKAPGLCHSSPTAIDDIRTVLADYIATNTPLPMLEDHDINRRLTARWSTDDPVLPVATGILARQAGYTQLWSRWQRPLRGPLRDAVAAVGVEKAFARDAAEAPTANGNSSAWTLPLHRSQAVALVGIIRTAALIVVAATSGMRASELMELRVGCRRPIAAPVPGLERYRIASKIVKGQPLGGTDDEWVVIEPAYRAVELAEKLHDNPREGALLFSRFAFQVRYTWFRNWVNSPAGVRLGLAPIPEGPVTLRMLRRTLALEMAYRPGGVLATKLHLKHIATATTEGYASRPGGAQAELLAEVNKHEADRNLQLVLAEFHNYQQGILPAGPGARSLTEFFTSVDTELNTEPAAAPKIQRNDRDILNLLSKRANTLHLGAANYCWFTDPSRALCLKLADTPTADRPLIGMCDSARCPQATHHQVHRPVWIEHAERTKTFLGQLGRTRTTEHARLQADHHRALRVIADIDAATTPTPSEEKP